MDTGEGRFEIIDNNDAEVQKLIDQMSAPLKKLQALEQTSTLKSLRKKYPKSKGLFIIGEELEIKGSLFKVKDISPWGIKLKLLPAQD